MLQNLMPGGHVMISIPLRGVYRQGERGEKLEPLEEVVCEVADHQSGDLIQAMTARKAEVGGPSPRS